MRKLNFSIISAIALLLCAPAYAQHFSNTIFFGDSNSDSGRYLYLPGANGLGASVLAPAGAGAYTTNPGLEWSAVLGGKFGITVTPSDAPGGGNNFAAGGATVATSLPGNQINAWSAQSQVAAYLSSTGGTADPNALYTMWIGINNLKAAGAGGLDPHLTDIVTSYNQPALIALGEQTASIVEALAGAGARYIVVPNTAEGTNPANNVNKSRALYDQTVYNSLNTAGVNFIPADISTLYNYILSNPSPFGITNTTGFACPVISFTCLPSQQVPGSSQTYYLADSFGHKTAAVQQITADYVFSLVTAPSLVSYLAENAVKTRERLVMSIQNQIELSQRGRGPTGANAWASGDLGLNSMDNYPGFPNDPDHAVALSAGVDYRFAPGMIAGVALSAGSLTSGFGGGFGNFTQDEVSGSLYGAATAGPMWANAILSYGRLSDTVNRTVPLGISQQFNTGSTGGNNWSGALQGGYKLVQGDLTHGPVAALLAQRVTVGSFTESGSITSLGFGTQQRDSFVTMLGYRASYRLGPFEPFIQATWDHEFANANRLVSASLTTLTAPSYTMPAVVLGKDWGTTTLGTTYDLGSGALLTSSVSADFAQSSATTYTGEVGVNFKF